MRPSKDNKNEGQLACEIKDINRIVFVNEIANKNLMTVF